MSEFFALCSFMGVLQINENVKLMKQKVGFPITNGQFSLVEFLWLIVVVYILSKYELSLWGRVTCAIFIFFHIYGWVIGFYAYKQAGSRSKIAIPNWYYKTNIAIASAFTLSSIYVLIDLIL